MRKSGTREEMTVQRKSNGYAAIDRSGKIKIYKNFKEFTDQTNVEKQPSGAPNKITYLQARAKLRKKWA